MLALLFPGQGSQSVGMGRDVFQAAPAARAVFEAADAALGLPLSRLCFEGPEQELVPTEIQQPAILTVSVALLRALEARTALRPDRGRYMQEAVPEGSGAMAALLGLEVAAVEAVCERARAETGALVTPANYNAPQQTVVAGALAAVEAACAAAREAGAKRALRLPVSAPFHCALMEPAAEKLGPELQALDFRAPVPPLVTNVEARPNADPKRIAELLRRQVTAPVRFVELVEQLAALGVERVLEVGPGRVLSGLVGRVARGLSRANLAGLDDLPGAAEFAAGGGP
jgi:[acyl-carrier-protein] S-malonyltransferase